jgi:cytochrome c
MKRTFLILGATAILMASLTAAKPETEPAVNVSVPAIAKISTMQMSGGELLINKSDCIGCHHKVNKLIGPSYTDIAKKYPNNEKNINYLANKIIKGGSGVWGKIPMTPHPKVSTNDAKLMAKYILSLKKK